MIINERCTNETKEEALLHFFPDKDGTITTYIFTRKTLCTVFSKMIVKKNFFLRLQIENCNIFFLQSWRSIVIYKFYNVAHVGILFYNLDDYCIRPIQLN
jgi:hypothetical protein